MTDIDLTPDQSERALLAGILAEPTALRFATEHVTPHDFADVKLGALLSKIVAMSTTGQPTDAFAVAAACGASTRGLPAGSEVLELHSLLIPGATVAWHAQRVRSNAVLREVSTAGHRMHLAASAQDADASQVVATAMADLTSIREGASAGPASAPTLGEVLAEPLDYDWVVPGLLESQDRFMLTGGEGGGKTTLLRQMAIMINAGLHPFTAEPIEPVDVLYIDVENTRRQWSRQATPLAAKSALMGARDPRDHLYLECRGRLDLRTERDLGLLHRFVDEHKPQVLVIGPLYKLVGGAINSDDDAAPLLAALDSLRERGLVLLMEAHAGHGQTTEGVRNLRPRGSSALLGWPEFGYGISRDPQLETRSQLVRWRGDRDQRDWPEWLVRGGAWPWTDQELQPGRAVNPYRKAS